MKGPALSMSIVFLLAAGTAAPSLACTISWPPPPPPSQAELDTTARARLYDPAGIVEVVMTSKVTVGEGTARVLQVVRGNFRKGQILQVRARGSTACGPDEIPAGRRGFVQIQVQRGQIHLWDFLRQPLVDSLLRQRDISWPSSIKGRAGKP